MWRYLAAGVGAVFLIIVGYTFATTGAAQRSVLPNAPLAAMAGQDAALPDSVPEASAKTREEKRFGRYDKDKDGAITRAEYLASRRKAYVRLDSNGDGQLSFDEWAAKTTARFATADADKNGAMNPAEFATTAPKRRARATPKCVCPAAPASGEDEG